MEPQFPPWKVGLPTAHSWEGYGPLLFVLLPVRIHVEHLPCRRENTLAGVQLDIRWEGPQCWPRLAPGRRLAAGWDVGGGSPCPSRLLSHSLPLLPAPGGKGGRGVEEPGRSRQGAESPVVAAVGWDGQKSIGREQVRFEGGPGVSEWGPCSPWIKGSNLSPQNFLTLDTYRPHSASFSFYHDLFLFIDFVDLVPASGPLYLLFLKHIKALAFSAPDSA